LTDTHNGKIANGNRTAQKHLQKGIKRWELALVLAISSVIAVAIGVIVYKRIGSAVDEQVDNDFRRISVALHQYKLDNKRYPTSDQGLLALFEKPRLEPLAPLWKGPYINRETLIHDPWKNAYLYTSSAAPPGFEITTLGADAKAGGTDLNADMSVNFQSDENYFD
jgi:general secretion pathway protein G